MEQQNKLPLTTENLRQLNKLNSEQYLKKKSSENSNPDSQKNNPSPVGSLENSQFVASEDPQWKDIVDFNRKVVSYEDKSKTTNYNNAKRDLDRAEKEQVRAVDTAAIYNAKHLKDFNQLIELNERSRWHALEQSKKATDAREFETADLWRQSADLHGQTNAIWQERSVYLQKLQKEKTTEAAEERQRHAEECSKNAKTSLEAAKNWDPANSQESKDKRPQMIKWQIENIDKQIEEIHEKEKLAADLGESEAWSFYGTTKSLLNAERYLWQQRHASDLPKALEKTERQRHAEETLEHAKELYKAANDWVATDNIDDCLEITKEKAEEANIYITIAFSILHVLDATEEKTGISAFQAKSKANQARDLWKRHHDDLKMKQLKKGKVKD